MENNQGIQYDYIVGEEKKLAELIKGPDIMPLLKSAVNAGASSAALVNSDGEPLFQYGDTDREAGLTVKKPVYLEGETAGHIIICGHIDSEPIIKAVGELMFDAVKIILQSNFKTLLATETHKTVVYQSYEELIETNRKLKLSEGKYRELANSLEKQVQERTEELKKAHAKLLHQEKLASVGQLAAGVAHEINNPLGFISSNINTLNQYISKLKEMLLFYHGAFEKQAGPDEDAEASKQKWKKLKLDFIFEDANDLIRESLDGTDRVKKIVSDLKGFSHIDEAHESDADINAEIDRTLNVLTHEIPDEVEIIKDYGNLPSFSCNPAHICQAFYNLILNALQAGGKGLVLKIATRSKNNMVAIDISDNGPGIPGSIRNRIFEPFFTTKEVGKGTGMGLNVTFEIVSSYGGTIEADSEVGKGTTFSIMLPLPQKVKDV